MLDDADDDDDDVVDVAVVESMSMIGARVCVDDSQTISERYRQMWSEQQTTTAKTRKDKANLLLNFYRV